MHIDQASTEQLRSLLAELERDYAALGERGLTLDLTRGKPGVEQVALSDPLDGILAGNYISDSGVDVRNYNPPDLLAGLPEARALFGGILGAAPEETLVGGNSSLTLMYQCVDFLLRYGRSGPDSAWERHGTVRFLCPVPGYDRHFSICEYLGIDMLPVPLLETGPDMDAVEELVRADPSIRGIWCVPRFSNPTGCVYSAATVERIARLPLIAGPHFAVLWDNAYAVHALYDDAPALEPIDRHCRRHGTLDGVFQFGSTSKVTFAGAGLAYLASSKANVDALVRHLSYRSIGPDKVNQLRHLRFLPDRAAIDAHMGRHAALVRPRFEAVLETLERELGDSGMGAWTRPRGGYFISFDTLPGLAAEVVRLAAAVGVKLTPAGATFPHGRDPGDRNIRLAPTFPPAAQVREAVDAFVLCVRLASVRRRLAAT